MTTPPSDTQRVAAQLSRKIRDMQPGEAVGSVRSIAASYSVSVDSARRALGLLTRHGLVQAEARRHVVADPTAPMGKYQAVEDLQKRVEELERWRAEIEGRDS